MRVDSIIPAQQGCRMPMLIPSSFVMSNMSEIFTTMSVSLDESIYQSISGALIRRVCTIRCHQRELAVQHTLFKRYEREQIKETQSSSQ